MNYFNMSKLNGTLETGNGKTTLKSFMNVQEQLSCGTIMKYYYEAYLKLSQTITIKVFAESR